MRVVAIDGSTIAGGSVARAVETAAKAAARAGAEVVRIRLYDAFRAACLDCGACRRGSPCPLPEGLAPLLEAVENADGLIVGHPPARGFVADEMKTLLDRAIRRFSNGGFNSVAAVDGRGGRRAIVITQSGVSLPEPLARLVEQRSPIRRCLQSRGVETVGSLVVGSQWGDPLHRDLADGRANVLGKRLVRAIA